MRRTTWIVAIATSTIVAVGSLGMAMAANGNATHGHGPMTTDDLGSNLTPCASLVGLAIPADTEVNTVMDAERGLIQLSYTDPTSGSETEFAVNYAADADCANNAALQRVIKHAEKAYQDAMAEECVSLQEALASGVTEARGVTLNREALRTYTEQHC